MVNTLCKVAQPGQVFSMPFPGRDLEQTGVFEATLAARAPFKELVFLSVGDTRDHRRQYKDPALRTISIDFFLNLIANLRKLGIDHTLVLSTRRLCRWLQRNHCFAGCSWSSLWNDHPGLTRWNLREGDMFLMWAQQWRYIARALELGYRVLRADSDVYFAENPYPILHGPLLAPFSLVVQQDFGGPLGVRPACESPALRLTKHAADGSRIGVCGLRRGSALLNVGLLYVKGTVGGGSFAVINGTWESFLAKLSSPPKHGVADPAALIDQELMRRVVDRLAVSEPQKPRHRWSVVPGSAAAHYATSASCALGHVSGCARVAAERSATAFLANVVQPPQAAVSGADVRAERIALAPDWLFGRGCLVHVHLPVDALRKLAVGAAERTPCKMPPVEDGSAMGAPGPAAGLLVATHFVYSMALKRKR